MLPGKISKSMGDWQLATDEWLASTYDAERECCLNPSVPLYSAQNFFRIVY